MLKVGENKEAEVFRCVHGGGNCKRVFITDGWVNGQVETFREEVIHLNDHCRAVDGRILENPCFVVVSLLLVHWI